MKFTIQYFAILKDQAKTNQESLDTTANTPALVYAELRKQHGFTLAPGSLKVAINDAFADWETPLADGDLIVFIPPVAGG